MSLIATWFSEGRRVQHPPDPGYPLGMLFDASAGRPFREVVLQYPVPCVLRSRDYKLYLVAEYRRQHGRVPGVKRVMKRSPRSRRRPLTALNMKLLCRVGGDDPKSPEKTYLDLVDESWRVVEIDARGWQIISNPPVHFFPPKGLRGLPPPKRINIGTGIRKLQALVNVTGDAFIMYVSWMFACLWPSGPYTILVLTGEHGTAKATAAEVAREVEIVTSDNLTPLHEPGAFPRFADQHRGRTGVAWCFLMQQSMARGSRRFPETRAFRERVARAHPRGNTKACRSGPDSQHRHPEGHLRSGPGSRGRTVVRAI